MRKQVLTISLSLLAIGAFAQKKELKLVEKALSGNDYSTALSTLSSVESVVNSGEDKYKSKFYFLKGKALAGQKKYSEAYRTFGELFEFEKKAGKVHTNDAKALVSNMADEVKKEAFSLYSDKKDYKAAAEKFYLTYKLNPADTSLVYNSAVSSYQAKDFNAALKSYKELKDLGYTGIEQQYVATNKATGKVENLGSKSQRDLMVKAGKYIKPDIISSKSKKPDIVKNIAFILKNQGKDDEAIAAIQEARQESPKDLNLILNEAELYAKMDKMDKFGELMNEAIALNPNDPDLYYNLGVVNYNQGKIEDAKKYYQKAIELKPDYVNAYSNMAVAILQKDQSIIDEMNENLSNFKKYDALEAQRKDLYREALPYLEKVDAINRNFDNVKILMRMYEVLGNTSKAQEYKAIFDSLK